MTSTVQEFFEKVTGAYTDWDDDIETFYDYMSPGNVSIGDARTLSSGETLTCVDEYYRRIEEEEVWVVFQDFTGQHWKVYGEFTSWDSVNYKYKRVERQEVVKTEWV